MFPLSSASFLPLSVLWLFRRGDNLSPSLLVHIKSILTVGSGSVHFQATNIKDIKSAWCKGCATGLIFGFKLNKVHGCHLRAQLIIMFQHHFLHSAQYMNALAQIFSLHLTHPFTHWWSCQHASQHLADGNLEMWAGAAVDWTTNAMTVVDRVYPF